MSHLSNDTGTDEKSAKGQIMTKTDMKALMRPSDILMALGLLTRLPIPVNMEAATKRGAAAAWAYPLVGALIASIALLVGWAVMAVGLNSWVAAVTMLGTQIILTGAMHEDGLADCADGFWGGWDPSRRLEIMKDSQIGTYGVLALVLVLLVRFAAIADLFSLQNFGAHFIAAGLISRGAMVGVMGSLPNARKNGLSQSVGKPSLATTFTAVAIAVIAGAFLVGWIIISLAIVAAILALGCGLIARSKIGGQTGDVLGATQQITEVGVLLTALALLA